MTKQPFGNTHLMQGMFSLAVEPHFIKIYFLPTPLVKRLQMDFFSFSSFPSPTLRYKDYIYVFILGTENAMCVCVWGGVGVGAWFLR